MSPDHPEAPICMPRSAVTELVHCPSRTTCNFLLIHQSFAQTGHSEVCLVAAEPVNSLVCGIHGSWVPASPKKGANSIQFPLFETLLY